MNRFGTSKGVAKKPAVPLSERLALSPEEASALSGVGVTAIREAAACGALKARKHGTRTLILLEDLKAWLQTLPPVTGKKTVGETEPCA